MMHETKDSSVQGRKPRRLSGWARATLVCLMVGATATSTQMGVEKVAAKETITVMMSYTNPERKAAFETLAAAFEKATDIRADLLVDTSGQTYLKMKLMAAAGKPPDVFAGGAYAYDLAASGLLADLGSLMERDGLSGNQFSLAPWQSPATRGCSMVFPYGINKFAWKVPPLPKGKRASTVLIWLAYGIAANANHREGTR